MERFRRPEYRPSSSLTGIIRRLATLITEVAKTRLRLIVVELEEEKNHILQLLLMTGITLLSATFGMMCLLIYILLFTPPEELPRILMYTTCGLLGLAIFMGILVVRRAGRTRMLKETRRQLSEDVSVLTGKDDE